MIAAELIAARLAELGFSTYTGVPCSYLGGLIEHVSAADGSRYIAAANEGDAVALAAGLELAGRRTVVLLQNSGLGNAVNPLTSLTHVFRIPVLLLVTLRGEPNGPPDEPQHEFMGRITCQLLDIMDVPWRYLPEHEDELAPVLERAATSLLQTRRPFALVVRKGTVGAGLRRSDGSMHSEPVARREVSHADAKVRRRDVLEALADCIAEHDVIIATTGHTARELYALGDRPNRLYMVGAMGCASSLALGLALAQPHRRIVVVDGDGAALMRLGAVCLIGNERPGNLFHVLLDNGMHESTGGQATASPSIDFCGLAVASGYPVVSSVPDPAALSALYRGARGQLAFAHIPILPGSSSSLPRPRVTPEEVASRLRELLKRVP